MNITLPIIKDYPKPGVNFLDINPLLANPADFKAVISRLCAHIGQLPTEVRAQAAIITPEARGFIFAAPVAYELGLPLILIRKEGKIPHHPYPFHIKNEYTEYNMEVDGDLLARYTSFIYIDDILATGQTLGSVRQALRHKGKDLALSLHVTAVEALQKMREDNPQLTDLPVRVLI